MKTWLSVMIVFAACVAAAEGPKTGVEDVREMTVRVTRQLQNSVADLDLGWFVECGSEGRASQACADAFNDVYSKPVVKFTVTLGYTDVVKEFADQSANFLAAEDSIRREVWEQKLRRPCPKDDDGQDVRGTCGFRPDADDADRFTKTVVGPDGKEHTVEVRLTHSSVGYSDVSNRENRPGTTKPDCAKPVTAQDRQSCRAEKNFFDHICSSEGVIYAGHWRNGAGPSFSPPPLKPGTVAVNFAAYKNKEAEQRLATALKSCPTPPKILGLFACNSASLSASEMRAAAGNKTGVLTSSSLAEPEVVYAQAYAALDSMLSMRCAAEFDRSLNAVQNVIRRDGRGVRRDGFFGDAHPRFQCPSAEPPIPESKRSQTPLVNQPIHPEGSAPSNSGPVSPSQGGDSVK